MVGEVPCKNFHLTATGRGNLEKSINSLKFVGSLDAILEFDFGIEDVVCTMIESERCVCVVPVQH